MRLVSTTIMLLVAVTCGTSWAVEYSERSWTDDEGRTVSAKLVRVSGSTAILDQNGKVVRAPVNRLSDADQEWIKKVRELNRWREWTMADGSKRRLKFEDKEGDQISLKEGSETVELVLGELSDVDRALLATVFDTSSEATPPATFGSANPMLRPGVLPPGLRPSDAAMLNLPGTGEVREWTNVNGKKIEAEYRGVENGKIVLYFKDREWKVPPDQFVEADQQWVANQAMAAVQEAGAEAMNNMPPVASAGGNGFDAARNEIQGRMNPGFDSGEVTPVEPARSDPMAAHNEAMARMEQDRLEHQRRAEERMAELQRQQEERMAERERERQERLAMASSNSMNTSPSYSPPPVASHPGYGHASSRTSPPVMSSHRKGPNVLGLLLMLIGMGMAFVGGLWMLVVAFQESVLWVLACWLIPFAGLVFVAMHWDKASRPFLLNIGGLGILFLGVFVGGL